MKSRRTRWPSIRARSVIILVHVDQPGGGFSGSLMPEPMPGSRNYRRA
jgi:hypothetical protein